MQFLIFLTILAGVCFAHYRGGYENHNLIEREEPDVPGVYCKHYSVAGNISKFPSSRIIYPRVLVECPVCENVDGILSSHEKCKIMKGGKRYKKCERGTYVNEVCGNRIDCYRGPGEVCSEKMAFDDYGLKCARGFYCHDVFHVCTGPGYTIDSNSLWVLNGLYRYPLQFRQQDRPLTKSESAMVLA